MPGTKLSRWMGKIVLVKQELRRKVKHDIEGKLETKIEWKSVEIPRHRAGWIVGFCWVQNGTLFEGSAPRYPEDEGERPFLRIASTTFAVKVCYWPTMKPVLVLRDQVFPSKDVRPQSPSRYSWENDTEESRERVRTATREDASNQPRNANGTFKKGHE